MPSYQSWDGNIKSKTPSTRLKSLKHVQICSKEGVNFSKAIVIGQHWNGTKCFLIYQSWGLEGDMLSVRKLLLCSTILDEEIMINRRNYSDGQDISTLLLWRAHSVLPLFPNSEQHKLYIAAQSRIASMAERLNRECRKTRAVTVISERNIGKRKTKTRLSQCRSYASINVYMPNEKVIGVILKGILAWN